MTMCFVNLELHFVNLKPLLINVTSFLFETYECVIQLLIQVICQD